MTARRLRRDATEVERLFWHATRSLPWKLRRQHPIGRHIVDFACPQCKLAIELDGGQHDAGAAADARRTAEIAGHGYRVIRFWNNEVLENIDGVLQSVRQALAASPTLCLPNLPEWAAGRSVGPIPRHGLEPVPTEALQSAGEQGAQAVAS